MAFCAKQQQTVMGLVFWTYLCEGYTKDDRRVWTARAQWLIYVAETSKTCVTSYVSVLIATQIIRLNFHCSVFMCFDVISYRFIPNDVTFGDRTATSSCIDADITKDYQPSE